MAAALSTTLNHFHLAPLPEQGLLTARWTGPLHDADAGLRADYALLLSQARAQGNCRFWLLDMRGRNWHSASFGRWFGSEFARQATQALGGPVFVAYVVDASHRPVAESTPTATTQRACAAHDFYPYFFDNPADARDWLCHQQEYDPAAGSCHSQQ